MYRHEVLLVFLSSLVLHPSRCHRNLAKKDGNDCLAVFSCLILWTNVYFVYACRCSWEAQSSLSYLQLSYLFFVFSTLFTYRRMALLLSPRQPNTRPDSVQHSLHLSCASHGISTEQYLNHAKKSRTIWCHSHEAGVRGYWFCNLTLITLSTFQPYQPWISALHL